MWDPHPQRLPKLPAFVDSTPTACCTRCSCNVQITRKATDNVMAAAVVAVFALAHIRHPPITTIANTCTNTRTCNYHCT